MSLQQLPPEIMMEILVHVGSPSFREDLGRLTICKQWFRLASIAFFKDLEFTPKTLERFLSSQDMKKSLDQIQNNMEVLRLHTTGYEDWSSLLESQGSWDRDDWSASSWGLFIAWTNAFNMNLTRLAHVAKRSRRLREIHIQGLPERHPSLPYLPRRYSLRQTSLIALLSVGSLTVLELDLCGAIVIDLHQGLRLESSKQQAPVHICTRIGALLATLKRLRLRMRSVCTDVLSLQHLPTDIPLEEVLVNLSLSNEHSTRCGPGGGPLDLRNDIIEQAKALVTHMKTPPRIIRILTHSVPQLEVRSLDILTGRWMELADNMAWDDDGKIIGKISDSITEILDVVPSVTSAE